MQKPSDVTSEKLREVSRTLFVGRARNGPSEADALKCLG